MKEDPWRYCYDSSRLNELVRFTVEWLVKQLEAASRRALEAVATIEVNIPARDKGKRKIVNAMEEEKSYKFLADPLVEKVAMTIEEKRQKCDKRSTQR